MNRLLVVAPLLISLLLAGCQHGDVTCYSEGKVIYQRKDVDFAINHSGGVTVYTSPITTIHGTCISQRTP